MDSQPNSGRQTHNISLDADTSRTFLALIRRRFNIGPEQELPRGVVSWYVQELVEREAAGIEDLHTEASELALVS